MTLLRRLSLAHAAVRAYFHDHYRMPFLHLVMEIEGNEDWTLGDERELQPALDKFAEFAEHFSALKELERPEKMSLLRRFLAYMTASQRFRVLEHIGQESGLAAPDFVETILNYTGNDQHEAACVGVIKDSLSVVQRESMLMNIINSRRIDKILQILRDHENSGNSQ